MGVSSRITNKNPLCKLERETRICTVRPCHGLSAPTKVKYTKLSLNWRRTRQTQCWFECPQLPYLSPQLVSHNETSAYPSVSDYAGKNNTEHLYSLQRVKAWKCQIGAATNEKLDVLAPCKYSLSAKAIFILSLRTEIILVVLLGSSTSSGNRAVLIYSAVFWWQAGAFLNIVPRPQHSCQATVHS